jgi:S-DNA-T family DNA segregation ATPase FtsK/SpoIIIE
MGIKLDVSDTENKNRAPWWWRRRVGLTPFYFGVLSAVCAGGSWALSVGQTVLVLLAIGAVAAGGAQKKWGGRKKDRAQRNFVWAVIACFVGFVLAVRTETLGGGWIFVAALVGIFGLGAFWWADNSNIHRVKVERDQERWPVMAKAISMPKVRRGPEKKTETGRRWTFYWDPGDYTLQAFKANARTLESVLKIPENRIRFENVYEGPGMKNPNAIIVTENTESKNLKAPVPFSGPTMRKITDPMYIGNREDGTKHEVTWYDEEMGGMHTLAAGSTGSGKSGLYNLVMAESAYCPDVVRWGIDAKGGMALRPWAPLFDWMVTDVDSGEMYWMLHALLHVLKKRSEYAAAQGWSCWQPSKDHPVLIMVVDEAAEVFGIEAFDMNSLSASIARMGRAAGVLLLIATQHPTNDAIGSTQLTKNLRRRFCFSVEDEQAQRVVIPKSHGRFDASDIPIGKDFAGTYYSSEGGLINDLSGRVRFVTQFQIYELMLEVSAPGSPVAVRDLDQMSQDAAMEGSKEVDEDTEICHYAERKVWTINDIKPPKGWAEAHGASDGAPPLTSDGAPAPVHGAPAAPDDEPVQFAAMGVPGGAGPDDPGAVVHPPTAPVQPAPTRTYVGDDYADDDPIPWTKEDPPMNLDQMVQPTSAAERADLDAAIAAYVAANAETNVSAERAQELLDEMLDAAGPNGLAIADMKKGLGRSSSWYSDHLAKRIHAGTVAKAGTRYGRPSVLNRRDAEAAEAAAGAAEAAGPALRVVKSGDSQ